MTDKKVHVLVKCINQLIRPKVKVPKFMRRKGCGDCTTCETHINNKNCKCYMPVGLISYDTSD